MAGRLEIDMTAKTQSTMPRLARVGPPLRLLVMGDFSGRGARGEVDIGDLARRTCHRIDFDNFDAVMQRLAPQVALAQGELLQFNELEDFHPDRLAQRVPALRHLNEMRNQLADPAQFAQAAAALQGGEPTAPGDAAGLQRLLGAAPGAAAPATPTTPAGGLDALLKQIVAPSLVPAAPAFLAQHQAVALARCGDELRARLHDPALQALEATWRGLDWLVSNLELDDELQIHLLDVSRQEMLADVVLAQGRVEHAALRQVLARAPDAGADWAALVTLFDFGASERDLGLLAALGTLASQLQTPLLVGAAALGAQGQVLPASPAWMSLCGSPVARWVGAAAPRLLLRQPYGAARDPIACFDFDEDDGSPLLWGCAALLSAAALVRSARGERADFDFTGWPSFVRSKDDAAAIGGAEFSLGEQACQLLLGLGLMPVVNLRGSTTVRLLRLQSLAGVALGG